MKVGCRWFVGTPGRTPTVCLVGHTAVQGFNASTLLLVPSVEFISLLLCQPTTVSCLHHVDWLCIKCACHSVVENNYFVLGWRLNGYLHISLAWCTVKLCNGFAVKSLSLRPSGSRVEIEWLSPYFCLLICCKTIMTLHCSWALFLDMTGRLSHLHVGDTPFSWSDVPNTWSFVHSDQVPICTVCCSTFLGGMSMFVCIPMYKSSYGCLCTVCVMIV
jgi:hypothetical protein